jgi:hypothetical protein
MTGKTEPARMCCTLTVAEHHIRTCAQTFKRLQKQRYLPKGKKAGKVRIRKLALKSDKFSQF